MIRKLKVHQTGDNWRGTVQPYIRFGGAWLRKAGFEPKDRYLVEVLGHGQLLLKKQPGLR